MSAEAVFGLKEEARPEGFGYLYLSFKSKTDGRQLAYFDLYKTSDEQFREILLSALPGVLKECDFERIQLVNFKRCSADIFREVAAAYTDIEIVYAESEARLHF